MVEAAWVTSGDLSEAQLGMCLLVVPTGQTGGAEEASRGKVLCPGRNMEMGTGKMALKMHSAFRDQGQRGNLSTQARITGWKTPPQVKVDRRYMEPGWREI